MQNRHCHSRRSQAKLTVWISNIWPYPMRLLFFLLALLAGNVAQAEIYTWEDANGTIQFGDRPPTGSEPKQLELKINTVRTPEVQLLGEGELSTRGKGKQNERQVVIYTTDWCGVCRQAKQHFKRNHIPYREYDVEKTAKGRRDYKRLNGTGVPIILVGDQRMHGFSPDRFDHLYGRP